MSKFIDTTQLPFKEEGILDLYEKIRVCKNGVQIVKKPIDEIFESYLDNSELAVPDNFKASYVCKVYGLHRNPFGATLEEVIKLIYPHLIYSEKVLITTQFCNENGDVVMHSKDCRDSNTGLYMAFTTIWGTF